MTPSVLKPRGDEIHEMLKALKVSYDDPRLTRREPGLYRAAMLSDDPIVLAWKGELLHQLALRAERRDETSRAKHLYKCSRQAFDDQEVLGIARETRDYAMLLCKNGEHRTGLHVAHEALELHQEDRANEKGVRQLRVTEGYVLRARVLSDDMADKAVLELVDMALHGCEDFCLRDQEILVRFALPYVDRATKRALHTRLLNINADRGKVVRTIGSIADIVIDTELMLTGNALRKLFRKE